jgi:hypothetical protein
MNENLKFKNYKLSSSGFNSDATFRNGTRVVTDDKRPQDVSAFSHESMKTDEFSLLKTSKIF